MLLVTPEEMRKLDEQTIKSLGISGTVLMELAGNGATLAITERWAVDGASVLVVAGKGNNGGDGFVVARHLHNNGADVHVLLLGRIQDVKGDAAVNLGVVQKLSIPLIELYSEADIMDLEELFLHADIIIDAVFGTGLERNVVGLHREIISMINASPAVVVSLDMPSGINAATGAVMGITAVKADLTVTFGYPKVGQYASPGFEYCGEIVIVDISIPPDFHKEGKISVLSDDWIQRVLPVRSRRGHKGSYGHAMIFAGSPGKLGAAVMAAESALTAGSGLVTVLTEDDLMPVLMNRFTEIMLANINPGGKRLSSDEVLGLIKSKSVFLTGPGIAKTPENEELIKYVVQNSEVPLVLDADALNILAKEDYKQVLTEAKAPVVITPHPGEMSRLLGTDTDSVQNNRVAVASDFAAKYNVFVVLKGARTVIATPDGRVAINPTGNPGMATGGSGDVLAGFIAAFVGQGIPAFEASCIAVFLHGRAGDLVVRKKGELSLKAGDLINFFPMALYSLDISELDGYPDKPEYPL